MKTKLSAAIGISIILVTTFSLYAAVNWPLMDDSQKDFVLLVGSKLLPLALIILILLACGLAIYSIIESMEEKKCIDSMRYQESMATMFDFVDIRQFAILVRKELHHE